MSDWSPVLVRRIRRPTLSDGPNLRPRALRWRELSDLADTLRCCVEAAEYVDAFRPPPRQFPEALHVMLMNLRGRLDAAVDRLHRDVIATGLRRQDRYRHITADRRARRELEIQEAVEKLRA